MRYESSYIDPIWNKLKILYFFSDKKYCEYYKKFSIILYIIENYNYDYEQSFLMILLYFSNLIIIYLHILIKNFHFNKNIHLLINFHIFKQYFQYQMLH